MTLARATFADGRPVGLPGNGPFAASALLPLRGVPFDLPPGDPFVLSEGTDAHTYLDGARQAWSSIPDHMDFLADDSPIRGLKVAERELYLHHWGATLGDAERILDVGAGIGRFALPLLEQGRAVEAVDADLDSLRTLAWRAAGGRGRLDLHWTAATSLPEIAPVDLAICCEVLCYVPEIDRALAGVAERLRTGGRLWISMEAQHGWAASPDAPDAAIEAALDGREVLHVPGEAWVRLYGADGLRDLLRRHGFDEIEIVATHYVLDGPLEQVGEVAVGLGRLVDLEERCRAHPVWSPLNRIWTATAVKR